jgi:hypothetical protein
MSQQGVEQLMDTLILGDCVFMLSKNYDGGVNLRNHKSPDLIHALEKSIVIDRQDLAELIREELAYRMEKDPTLDENEEDYDPSQGRHSGYCRGCESHQPDVSNDDGYCGDCN